MDAVILCGGRGTRLAHDLPKPLVEVGGRPIVWHVVRLLAAQGVRRFWLATGHRGEEVAAFAAGERWPDGVEVTCVDTGVDTPSGGRLHRLAGRLRDTLDTHKDAGALEDLWSAGRAPWRMWA